jgi:hypothetical protein
MTAALKMAAPGELCAHSKKLMEFCKVQARSIKAMRQHLGVTHERIGDLLGEMLAKKLLWRQHNSLYKTVTDALQYDQTEQQAANSLLALADADAQQPTTETTAADEDITELDIDIAEQQLGTSFATAPEFKPATYDLDIMAAEFEAEQERGDRHQVDNITAKQRAINYCQMLLSPQSTELRRCLDELQMDLAVIALQQERSA